jgi:hydrophobic/amphiphilic exporter-1 (mainly G- bacteria), HAE1 family
MKEIVETLFIAIVLVILSSICFSRTGVRRSSPCWPCLCRSSARSSSFPLFGFSINTLSMFGLVLAIGLVVDDAIVVVEGVQRHIERA